MITTQTDYEKVFNLFIGKDEHARPDLQQPFKQGERYFATDAYSIIFLPVEKAKLNFAEQDKPKASSIIPREPNCKNEIKVSDIERQLIPTMIDETEELEIKKECSECDGDGVLECDLGHEHDCLECDGEGKIITTIQKATGKKILMQHKMFKMLGVGFQYKQLRRLVDACNMMGVETITKIFGTETNGNLFVCGDASIMVMPAIINGDEIDEYKPTEINV